MVRWLSSGYGRCWANGDQTWGEQCRIIGVCDVQSGTRHGGPITPGAAGASDVWRRSLSLDSRALAH